MLTRAQAEEIQCAIHAEGEGWTTEVFHDAAARPVVRSFWLLATHPLFGTVEHRRLNGGGER